MKSAELFQPIFSRKPEPGHDEPALSFDRFLELLREEEDYFDGDQHNTKLMFTRLRKIYYDSWGWSTQVIRKAAKIHGRYQTEMIHAGESSSNNSLQRNGHNNKLEIVPLTYKVTYTGHDKIYPERAGQTPEIYAHDNQEVITPQGFYCDVGHILSGIDAYNNFEPISPLPNWLFFLRHLFPTVNSNIDFATWLGDVASSAGDFLLEELRKRSPDLKDEEETVDKDAPGSDMIGNIDSYAIKEIFNTKSSNGMRVTEILRNYFYNPEYVKNYQSKVITIFCAEIGLKNWDGQKFSNEKDWARYYKSQLRNATAFYVYGEVGKIKGIWLSLKIWLRLYEKVVKLNLLLDILLKKLKELVIYEQNLKV